MFLSRDGWAVAFGVASSEATRATPVGASSAFVARRRARGDKGESGPSRVRLFLDRLVVESAKTGKTENTLEPGESHEMLRSEPRTIASRFVQDDENSSPGGSTLSQSQTRLKTRAEKPEKPKIARRPQPGSETSGSRRMRNACPASDGLRCGLRRRGPAATGLAQTAQTARTSGSSMKWHRSRAAMSRGNPRKPAEIPVRSRRRAKLQTMRRSWCQV